jgi:NADPH:quinone reductase-like Zn-dependent oxidoreductase
MKALYYTQHGTSDVLTYGELPAPCRKPDDVLIQVQAVALNHLDIWVRKGWKGLQLHFPHIPGSDIAGVVQEAPAQSPLPAGTRVIVNPGVLVGRDEWTDQGLDSISPHYVIIGEHIPGGAAEHVSVPSSNVLTIPDSLSFEEAATLPLVGTTAWRMLFRVGELKPKQTILVVGAGGGVNAMSIRLAALWGADVIALAGSTAKAQFARSLGANNVILYNDEPNWHRAVLQATEGRGADLVVDNVGAATLQKSLKAVARGGRVVTVGNTTGATVEIDNRLIFTKQIALLGSTMGSKKDFEECMSFLWQNPFVSIVDTVAPLSEGKAQMERLEAGEQCGKIVLTPH